MRAEVRKINIGDLVKLELCNPVRNVEITLLPPWIAIETMEGDPSEIVGYCAEINAKEIILSSYNPYKQEPAGFKKLLHPYSIDRIIDYKIIERKER
jgi:hypothetical protein